MSATMTQLLSSCEFCRLRYDTIPVKSASANVFSIPITQKCQILSCDTLVINERYVTHHTTLKLDAHVNCYNTPSTPQLLPVEINILDKFSRFPKSPNLLTHFSVIKIAIIIQYKS